MATAVNNRIKTGTSVEQNVSLDDDKNAMSASLAKVAAQGLKEQIEAKTETEAPHPHHKKHHHHRPGSLDDDPETSAEESLTFRAGTKNGQIQGKANGKGTVALAGEEELASFYENSGSLEGKSLAEALEARAAAASLAERVDGDEPDIVLGEVYNENKYSQDMRSASTFSAFDESPQLQLMLGEIVDLSDYLQDKVARGGGSELAPGEVAQIFNLAELKKKRRRGLAEEEDVDTLLLVQYLPIVYDAISRIISKGLDEEAIAKMESLKGEIAQLVRTAADPESPLFEMFKDVKLSLEDREMVEWDAA